jgi:hypothetical protein
MDVPKMVTAAVKSCALTQTAYEITECSILLAPFATSAKAVQVPDTWSTEEVVKHRCGCEDVMEDVGRCLDLMRGMFSAKDLLGSGQHPSMVLIPSRYQQRWQGTAVSRLPSKLLYRLPSGCDTPQP